MHASTIAKVPSDFFEPPLTAGAKRRVLRRRIALAVTGVVLAAGLGWTTQDLVRHDCRGFAWPDHNLTKMDGECIGWTIDRGFAFDPGLQEVTDLIAAENRDVETRAAAVALHYVRLAVLMPMTTTADSAMTATTIRHALEGVYVGQRRANHTSDFGTASPLIQLVLMNEGRSQGRWPEMTRALASMTGGDHPVVAAVGLGISLPATKDAAVALHGLGIPAIGGVLTAPGLSTPGLFQVSPSNDDYVSALRAYVLTRPELKMAVLAADKNENDLYVKSLGDAFQRPDLKQFLHGQVTGFIGSVGAHNATPAVFDTLETNVCVTQADMVFYAGRDRDLSSLIEQLGHRYECGRLKDIVILTGSTGLNLDPRTEAIMKKQKITLIDAASSDAVSWGRGEGEPPDGYPAFHQAFLEQFPEGELADGYAIGHHDAVVTATRAIHLFARQTNDRVPIGPDILSQINNLNGATHQVVAAGGTLSFDDSSDGWPQKKKVAILRLPADGTQLTPFTTD